MATTFTHFYCIYSLNNLILGMSTLSAIPKFRPYMLKLLDEAKEEVLKQPKKGKLSDMLNFGMFYLKNMDLEKMFYLELTPLEEEEKKLRIASFNKFERFIWKYTPGYKTTFMWALFMSLVGF